MQFLKVDVRVLSLVCTPQLIIMPFISMEIIWPQEVGSCIVCVSWLEEPLVVTYTYTCTILVIKIIALGFRVGEDE